MPFYCSKYLMYHSLMFKKICNNVHTITKAKKGIMERNRGMKEYSKHKYNIQVNNPPFLHLLPQSHIHIEAHTDMNRYTLH